jgi:hypothetical protein
MRELSESSVTDQAERFLGWHERRGGGMSTNFNDWARSKDFGREDQRAIWLEVTRLTEGLVGL